MTLKEIENNEFAMQDRSLGKTIAKDANDNDTVIDWEAMVTTSKMVTFNATECCQ